MFQASPTDPVQKHILLWLSSLDRRRGGYEVRGVRGWAHLKDIAAGLDRRLTDQLVSIAEREWVDRENIALPGRGTAVWLYRINPRGANVASVPTPEEPGPPEEAPPPRMIFTDPQWSSLQYMRSVKAEPFPIRVTTRETGWRTVKEIREGAENRSQELQIWPEDVHELERAGLLEKRHAPVADGACRPALYRITDLGERVTRLTRSLAAVEPAPDSTASGVSATGRMDEHVAELELELARVARSIARLLLQPRYDEAELAELDVRARELRERIRSAAPPRRSEPEISTWYAGSRLISGG